MSVEPEAWNEHKRASYWYDLYFSEVGKRAEAERRLRAAEKDAARYRHLRDRGGSILYGDTASFSAGWNPMICFAQPNMGASIVTQLTGEIADSMIDAAIDKARQDEKE